MAAKALAIPKAIPKKDEPEALPFEEQIRQRAHQIYLQRNGQSGSELDDWLQAEAELQPHDKE
jgi:hypothetical protein